VPSRRFPLERVASTLRLRAPRYDPTHRVYYWHDEPWTLEFGLRIGRGGDGAPPPPEGWGLRDVRAVGFLYRDVEAGTGWRVIVFPGRVEVGRIAPTALAREGGGARRATGRRGVRSIVGKIVRAEEEFWDQGEAASALLRRIAREPGETDPDSARFTWSAGGARVEADCVYVAAAADGARGGGAAASYIVNEVRLIAMEGERRARMLVVRPRERVLVRYGLTPLGKARGGGG